jgi:hypothetical protein
MNVLEITEGPSKHRCSQFAVIGWYEKSVAGRDAVPPNYRRCTLTFKKDQGRVVRYQNEELERRRKHTQNSLHTSDSQ